MHGGECIDGVCGKCRGMVKVIFGALVLLNIYVWPKWTANLNQWLAFFAVLVIVKGVLSLVMPGCPHCKTEMPAMKKGK